MAFPSPIDDEVAPSRYRLIAELGRGGMADVYLAVLNGPTGFRKLAVIKRLRKNLADDPEFLAMFLEEARLAARVNHPHVVQTYEVGYDGDHHFLAMEYLEGQSYAAALARIGRKEFAFALQLRILIDILEALHYAHDLSDFEGNALQLVHRDVSPANIIITYSGQAKLLDFGIAKTRDSVIETKAGVLKGKMSYMAPEQALGEAVDRRADLYAVGVMLWEAASGKRRWKDVAELKILQTLIGEDPIEPPDAAASGLPARVDEICLKAIARKPEERYASARELQADLESVLEDLQKRVTHRDLGSLIASAFAEDQKKLGAVIEHKLRELDQGVFRQNLVNLDVPSPVSTPSPPFQTRADTNVTNSGERSLGTTTQQFAASLRLRPWTLLTVALAIAAGAAVGFFGRAEDDWAREAAIHEAEQAIVEINSASELSLAAAALTAEPREKPPSPDAAPSTPGPPARETRRAVQSRQPTATPRKAPEENRSEAAETAPATTGESAARRPKAKPRVVLDPSNPWSP